MRPGFWCRPIRAPRGLAVGALVCLGALAATPATASAQGDALQAAAARVADEWGTAGADVERIPARFLYENDTMTLAVASPGAGGRACTTIALLGARGLSFHARIVDAEDEQGDDPDSRIASMAGVLEISSCDEGPIERLRVTSDAGRGAIEGVIARSAKPLSGLRTALPERSGGVLPPPPDAGPAPLLPSPRERAELAEARARRDGAAIEPRAGWAASGDGSGDVKLELQPGCHRVELFAAESRAQRGAGRRRRLDLDAEIRDEDDELLARDRTDSPDVRLDVCVGDPTTSTVIFAGAPPGTPLVATHASWPIPEHLPVAWGTEPRARMARALLARHATAPREDAVVLYAGPSGATPVPVPIEPGACYLAAAAVTHGHAHGLGLRVAVGARDARDERTSDDDAGVVAFCAGDRDRALVTVEARGVSLSWGLAVFRVASGAWALR